MAIVGFNLSKVLVERKDVFSGKISIKSGANITNIRKENISLMKDKETLRVDFDFHIFYDPQFARVEFKGFVLVVEEPKNIKNILNDWRTKKVSPALQQDVFNLVLRKCNVRALSLEEELNLPTHFPFPVVRPEDAQNLQNAQKQQNQGQGQQNQQKQKGSK